jgi:hypothetical protein
VSRPRAAWATRLAARNGTPDVLIDCFARLMRCAIVASGTMNVAAISAV